MSDSNKYTTEFDEQLGRITNLKWRPWVGKDYSKSKLLILGESTYQDDGEEWLDDPDAMRGFVQNQGLDSANPKFSNRRFFNAIEKTVLNQPSTSLEERERFWTSVAYTNVVQRIMCSRNEKPKPSDFDDGWMKVLQLLETIRPTVVIKLGIEGVGRLAYLMDKKNTGWGFIAEEFNWKRRPIVTNLMKDSYSVKIIFINHPTGSFGFDFSEWADVIINNAPGLREKILR